METVSGDPGHALDVSGRAPKASNETVVDDVSLEVAREKVVHVVVNPSASDHANERHALIN